MSKTKERIRDSQLRYKQGLGQNFIYDDDLLKELVRVSGVEAEDDVPVLKQNLFLYNMDESWPTRWSNRRP